MEAAGATIPPNQALPADLYSARCMYGSLVLGGPGWDIHLPTSLLSKALVDGLPDDSFTAVQGDSI